MVSCDGQFPLLSKPYWVYYLQKKRSPSQIWFENNLIILWLWQFEEFWSTRSWNNMDGLCIIIQVKLTVKINNEVETIAIKCSPWNNPLDRSILWVTRDIFYSEDKITGVPTGLQFAIIYECGYKIICRLYQRMKVSWLRINLAPSLVF